MADQSSFKSGSSGNVQNKPTKQDSERKDEYMGQYKDRSQGLSEAQKFGTDQMPVKNDAPPFKGLKSVGG